MFISVTCEFRLLCYWVYKTLILVGCCGEPQASYFFHLHKQGAPQLALKKPEMISSPSKYQWRSGMSLSITIIKPLMRILQELKMSCTITIFLNRTSNGKNPLQSFKDFLQPMPRLELRPNRATIRHSGVFRCEGPTPRLALCVLIG